MPRIAEFVQLPDGRVAVVLETPTTDEGSVTIWTEAERDRHTHLTRVDEREACAQVADEFARQGDWNKETAECVAASIRERTDQ